MQNFDLSFSDTKSAFSHLDDSEIKKAKFIFNIFKIKALVNYGPGMASFALKAGLPVKGMIKSTIFGQFCGGETIDECDNAVKKLWASGVGSILDYSVEGEETEENFDANVEEIKHTIRKASGHPQYPFCVFKATGIVRFEILEKVDAGVKLDHNEIDEYYRFKKRFEDLCKYSAEHDVRLLVDAEETWIQKPVDEITNEMMALYNTKKAIIYNTIQLYRKDRVEFLSTCIKEAKEKGYYPGYKLVRGAYMEKERARAKEQGYPDPINNEKEDTHAHYDKALQICFDHRDIVFICAGTHNEHSSLLLARLMHDHDIAPGDERFWFAQLYGMSDNISFNLAAKGYNVAKYLPYGPVISVMPYLGRRAKENSSMKGQMGRELGFILEEIKRRKSNKGN